MNTQTTVLNLSVQQLQALAQIQQTRDKLTAELEALADKTAAILAQAVPVVSAKKVKNDSQEKGRPKGTIKATILTHLLAAGRSGMTVLQLADVTGFDRKTIDRWVFSGSAKRTKGFKKIGPAHYRFLKNDGSVGRNP